MNTDRILIPEPFSLDDGTSIAPRKPGQKRCPRMTFWPDLHPDEVQFAEPGWVRPATRNDCITAGTEIYDEGPWCFGEDGYDGARCGLTCGCFVFCSKTDPNRRERVWILR